MAHDIVLRTPPIRTKSTPVPSRSVVFGSESMGLSPDPRSVPRLSPKTSNLARIRGIFVLTFLVGVS